MRVEHEDGSAPWPAGTLVASSVQGTWTASVADVRALSESFFEPLVTGNQKASLASLSP